MAKLAALFAISTLPCLAFSSNYCLPSEYCSYSHDGKSYDLTSLCTADGSGYMGVGYNYNVDGTLTKDGHIWRINVCGLLSAQCSGPEYCADASGQPTFDGATQCGTETANIKTGMALQESWTQECPGSSPPVACSRCEIAADKPSQGTWSILVDGDTPDGGVKATYPVIPEPTKEDESWNSCTDAINGRIVDYHFNCDCDQSEPLIMGVYSVMQQCNYTVKIKAKAACHADFCSTRSGGAKFLIFLVVAVVLYLAAALFINYRQTGAIGIPQSHKDAAGSFFGAAKDGVRYVFSGGSSSSSSSGQSSYFTEFKNDESPGVIPGQASPSKQPAMGYTDL